MKKMVVLTLLFSFLLSAFNCAQSKEIQPEKVNDYYESSKNIVKNKHYYFIGEVVYSNKNKEKLNSNANTIEINNSKVSGIVMSLKIENKSFNITGDIENYKALFEDDKRHISVSFDVTRVNQTYSVFIDVKPNRNAFLTVSTGNYNTISWTGTIKK